MKTDKLIMDRPKNKKTIFSLTNKQEKLVALLCANIAEQVPRPKYKLLLEAGYSLTQARNANKILNSPAIQSRLSELMPVEKMLEDRRRVALAYLTNLKLSREGAKGLTYIIDLLTKNHQLLTGGATSNEAVKIVFDESFKETAIDKGEIVPQLEAGGHVQDPTPPVENEKGTPSISLSPVSVPHIPEIPSK